MNSEIRSCKVCGEPFKVYASYLKKSPSYGVYCGRKCRAVEQLRGTERECPTCGKKFLARASQIKQGFGNYCSKPCFSETQKKRKTFTCIVCDGQFERTDYQIAKGYTRICSKACHDQAKRKLTTHGGGRVNLFTQWQKREWKKDQCGVCGQTHDLQLDHVIPRFAGGLTTKENAQTLCRKCNRQKYWREDLPYYSWLYKHSPHGRG